MLVAVIVAGPSCFKAGIVLPQWWEMRVSTGLVRIGEMDIGIPGP